jgi:hypothetical protein
MEELILVNNKFGWRKDGRYTILDLGTMPTAIVVKKAELSSLLKQAELGSLYCISLRGYFSFPDYYYKLRFETENEAIEFACKYMTRWIEELNNHLVNNNSKFF